MEKENEEMSFEEEEVNERDELNGEKFEEEEWIVNKEELPKNVVCLISGCEVYIVGTAHVSHKSAFDAKRTIQVVKPDTVVLELCKGRVGLLFAKEEKDFKKMEFKEIMQAIKKSGVFATALSYLYSRVGKNLEISPGTEFKEAFSEGLKMDAQCKIILGDRPVEVTLNRGFGLLSNKEKLMLVYELLKSIWFIDTISMEEIEKMKESDFITEMVKEFGKNFPRLLETLLYERDLYLCNSIYKSSVNHKGRVVAVVGLGHVEGIVKHWKKADEIDINPIMQLSPPSKLTFKRIMGVGAVVLIFVLIGIFSSIYFSIRWLF